MYAIQNGNSNWQSSELAKCKLWSRDHSPNDNSLKWSHFQYRNKLIVCNFYVWCDAWKSTMYISSWAVEGVGWQHWFCILYYILPKCKTNVYQFCTAVLCCHYQAKARCPHLLSGANVSFIVPHWALTQWCRITAVSFVQ